jgi:amino acid adenylation domain-containing protein
MTDTAVAHRRSPVEQAEPRTLVELLLRAVERHPAAAAVSDDEQAMDYATLLRRARALAARISSLGVTAEDRVGVFMPRTADTVVAVMGILLAGAAYVPVDGRYPAARRDHLLTAGRVSLVVTSPSWRSRLDRLPFPVLEWPGGVDDDDVPESAPVAGVAPESAACVLFTSGSTGTPKGVVLEHRQMVGFALDPAIPELGPGDRTGQAASISFDTFTFEVWRSVAGGAEIVVIPSMAELIGMDLRRELRRRRVTAMLAPAAALNHVMRRDREAFSSLRVLCSGGDVLLPGTCRELRAGGFAGELLNLYGPTEATVACTGHRVDALDGERVSVPIGTALRQAELRVLDESLRPLPPGAPGELYVSGSCVGRGYLDQPALTASRFVADPFAGDGRRMYRTGDRVVLREDGALEFLGRTDSQVKVSGYRVEPAEVERLVCEQPGVEDAAVLAVGAGSEQRLVAFVVRDRSGALLRQVRQSMVASVPDYLVPSEFVVLNEMPMDVHGKRDWDALRARLAERAANRHAHVRPRTETERMLARYWEDLLAEEGVGAEDDFFALGGHSMLAVRLRMMIRRDLGITLSPESLFENSVLAQQAELLDSHLEAAGR